MSPHTAVKVKQNSTFIVVRTRAHRAAQAIENNRFQSRAQIETGFSLF